MDADVPDQKLFDPCHPRLSAAYLFGLRSHQYPSVAERPTEVGTQLAADGRRCYGSEIGSDLRVIRVYPRLIC